MTCRPIAPARRPTIREPMPRLAGPARASTSALAVSAERRLRPSLSVTARRPPTGGLLLRLFFVLRVTPITLFLAISSHNRLTAALRRPAIVRHPLEFRFAGFEIDLARHELRRDGTLVPIEPQVFDLIVFLVRNRNRIVSKNELIEAVWQGRVVSEAALSSRISTARQVIGDNGTEQRLIRTHHKRGFRFVGTVENAASDTGQAAAPAVPLIRRPGGPALAVLPFQNISGDPAQECLADGLTGDIITGLSHQRWFSVVARHASFAFRGNVIDI